MNRVVVTKWLRVTQAPHPQAGSAPIVGVDTCGCPLPGSEHYRQHPSHHVFIRHTAAIGGPALSNFDNGRVQMDKLRPSANVKILARLAKVLAPH